MPAPHLGCGALALHLLASVMPSLRCDNPPCIVDRGPSATSTMGWKLPVLSKHSAQGSVGHHRAGVVQEQS